MKNVIALLVYGFRRGRLERINCNTLKIPETLADIRRDCIFCAFGAVRSCLIENAGRTRKSATTSVAIVVLVRIFFESFWND
jgi:hypothetical protein